MAREGHASPMEDEMRVGHKAVILLLTATALVGWRVPAHAAEYLTGGYVAGGFPMGDWGKIAGFGLALDGTNVLYPDPDKPLAWRSELGVLYNFSRTVGVPPANLSANSQLDLETKNWSLYFGIGPEFSRKKGDTSPFIFGTAGFDTYWTKSELSGTAGGSPYAAKHGDSRLSFAWSVGLGIRKHVRPSETIEISAEYRSGIQHDFVLPDEVTSSGTNVTANRESHSSDQILVRIGTLFGY
jgi:hypothetical protein